MVIFNSYVKLPEGIDVIRYPTSHQLPIQGIQGIPASTDSTGAADALRRERAAFCPTDPSQTCI